MTSQSRSRTHRIFNNNG